MDERSPNIQTTLELETSDATPFLPVLENTDRTRRTTFGDFVEKLYTDFQSNIYLCVVAVLSITGGILFGYDLGIISGAILQLTTEFCLGISKSEVIQLQSTTMLLDIFAKNRQLARHFLRNFDYISSLTVKICVPSRRISLDKNV